ncbi:MAG: hypothetical protein INF98_15845 [Roseomonas sp.]|nr:hypothetical protein [Roseomonas sp.]
MKKWLPQQLVTDRQASQAFLEYLAGLERDVAAGGGGGGGGPAAWGSITGTLGAQTDLALALNGKANTSHTHTSAAVTDFSEAVDDRVAALLVAGSNVTLTYNDAAGSLTIDAAGGTTLTSGTATVTVPNNRLEWSETVAATGVTGTNRILLSVAPHVDADENDAEMLDIAAMSAAPGTGQITVTLAFSEPTAGPIKLNWMAA